MAKICSLVNFQPICVHYVAITANGATLCTALIFMLLGLNISGLNISLAIALSLVEMGIE